MRTWLKDIRTEADLKQDEVASMVGMSRAAYGHIETGERGVSPKNAMKIANALGFEWTLFFEEPCHDLKNEGEERLLTKA